MQTGMRIRFDRSTGEKIGVQIFETRDISSEYQNEMTTKIIAALLHGKTPERAAEFIRDTIASQQQ